MNNFTIFIIANILYSSNTGIPRQSNVASFSNSLTHVSFQHVLFWDILTSLQNRTEILLGVSYTVSSLSYYF